MEVGKVKVIVIMYTIVMMHTFGRVVVADYEVEDEFVMQRKLQARNSILDSRHPDPHHVVTHLNYHVHLATTNNKTYDNNNEDEDEYDVVRRGRRRLKRKYNGPCVATNPIDQCWRCRGDWGEDRKRLATCPLGFGRRTTGGAAGELYTVVDCSDDDVAEPRPGTLRYGVIQKAPLWIVFARSMTIRLRQELMVNSDKTIDGRGAQVRICGGAGITIQYVHNVIIHGLKITNIVPAPGGMIRDSEDHVGLRTPSDGDGVSVFGSTNVWLDHLSMKQCADGLIDVIEGSTAVTISNCHFTQHNHVMLLGASDTNPDDERMQVTVAFNHFGKGLTQRMPRCRFGFFHVVNNDYTHWQMYAIGGSSHPVIVSQGNRFVAPPNPHACNVAHRQNSPESEWRHWSWTSQEDLLLNGAVFVTSGGPPRHGFINGELIPPKHGSCVRDICMFVGIIPCHVGKPC